MLSKNVIHDIDVTVLKVELQFWPVM